MFRGDEVQLRHTVHHDDLGAVRNGTTATIVDVGRDGLTLQLPDGRNATLTRDQIGVPTSGWPTFSTPSLPEDKPPTPPT